MGRRRNVGLSERHETRKGHKGRGDLILSLWLSIESQTQTEADLWYCVRVSYAFVFQHVLWLTWRHKHNRGIKHDTLSHAGKKLLKLVYKSINYELRCKHFWSMTQTFFDILEMSDWHVPNTVTWAVSLSLSPTMLVPTQMYMPASLFLVLEIISFPPRIWRGRQERYSLCDNSFDELLQRSLWSYLKLDALLKGKTDVVYDSPFDGLEAVMF